MSAETHTRANVGLRGSLIRADGSDPLFSAIIVIVVIAVLGIGVFYLKLHAIPEQLAHRHSNTQSQLIMVLALLALFTHNNVFWVAALILALLKLPDFLTPINSISESLKKLTPEQTDEESAAAPTEQSGEAR